MLIYNHKKELIGIDESDINKLGFKNLAELNSHTSEFADLFIKKPGCVHNFKHVHWIDFINASDSNELLDVVIGIKDTIYNAKIELKTIYLNDEPSLKGYIVNLVHLREDGQEIEEIHKVITVENKLPILENIIDDDMLFRKTIITPLDDVDEHPAQIDLDLDNEIAIEQESTIKDIDDLEITLLDDEIDIQPIEKKFTQNIDEVEDIDEDESIYGYDPHLASDELGLPVDLIEEFISDFVSQAKDFKPELYLALSMNDLDNIKIMSHKLKGVCANLRIDNAFDTLTNIYNATKINDVKYNLDKFYKIIEKLSEPKHKPKKENKLDMKIKQHIDDDAIEFVDDIHIMTKEEIDALDIEEVIPLNEFENITTKKYSILNEDEEMQYYIELVAHELGISQESFYELLNDFVVEAKNIIHTIQTTLIQNNPNLWQKEAIKFKGMSENMRLKDFSNDLDTIIHTKSREEVVKSIKSISQTLKKFKANR